MKVVVKKKEKAELLFITTEFIKLESAMKLANLVGTGGSAKYLIQEGEVLVNGEVCTMRGKKLRRDDTFTFHGVAYRIAVEDENEHGPF